MTFITENYKSVHWTKIDIDQTTDFNSNIFLTKYAEVTIQ